MNLMFWVHMSSASTAALDQVFCPALSTPTGCEIELELESGKLHNDMLQTCFKARALSARLRSSRTAAS